MVDLGTLTPADFLNEITRKNLCDLYICNDCPMFSFNLEIDGVLPISPHVYCAAGRVLKWNRS